MSRWRHNMPAVVCRPGFWFVCRAFSPARCHFQHESMVPCAPLRRKLTHVYVKMVRPKCTQILTVIIFCWSRDTVLLCAKNEYLQTHTYVFTTRIATRLTATTAILSRMCRQVWIGTFGICRLHARAPIPMQTNTLGISRCTDRYIRHMQTSTPTVYQEVRFSLTQVDKISCSKYDVYVLLIRFHSCRYVLPLYHWVQVFYPCNATCIFGRHEYHQFANIRRTQFQDINVSRLVMLLSLPNPLKPCVKLIMKM